MNILSIDTSNETLGVSVTEQNYILGELITSSKQDHSTRLMPAIVDMLDKTSMSPNELDAIVVAHGPGSYTGTRIGVTTAKSMAWGLDIPIYTVSSLALLAMNGKFSSYYICPFFNARRESVFTGLYKWENDQLAEVETECNVMMKDWLTHLRSYEQPILFLSPHLSIFASMIEDIKEESAIIPKGSIHTSRPSNMYELSLWLKEEKVHQVTPNYLRRTEAETNLLKQQKDELNNG